MSKFEVGDKVRRKPEFLNTLGWDFGDQVFEVIGFLNIFGAPEIQLSSESTAPGYWIEDRFELVTEEPEGEWVEISESEYGECMKANSRRRIIVEYDVPDGVTDPQRYFKWVPKLEWPTEPGSEFIYTYKDDPEQHRGLVLPYNTGDYAYTSFGGLVTDDARDHAMTLVEVIGK